MVSTNVAETSVTIPDVKYVIDTGKVIVLSLPMDTLTLSGEAQAT